MANAPKPTTAKKESSGSNIFASLSIVLCILVGILVWKFVMGDTSNFEGGDPENGHTLPGNYFGMVYKGGYVVPVLMGLFLMVVVFSFERFFVITKAAGTGNVDSFVMKIQGYLSTNNIEAAISECDKQKGSVANVVKSALRKYREVETDQVMNTEQKCLAI